MNNAPGRWPPQSGLAREPATARLLDLAKWLTALPSDTTLQHACDRTVQELADVLEVELGKVLIPERDGTLLTIVSGVGWDPDVIGTERVRATPTSQAGYALTVEGPVIFENLTGTKRFSDAALLRRHGVVSGVTYGLKCDGRVLGVLSVHSRARRRFTEKEVDLIEHVGVALAGALARLGSDTFGSDTVASS